MDDEDRRLRELFAHAPLADGGFGDRVVQRLKRDQRRRRLLMGLALVPGLLIAAEPVLQFVSGIDVYIDKLAGGLLTPHMQIVAVQGGLAMPLLVALMMAVFVATRILED